MMLDKPRIALAVTILALAAVLAVDTASAANPRFGGGTAYFNGGGFMYGCPCP
jgi:hypothetical protein